MDIKTKFDLKQELKVKSGDIYKIDHISITDKVTRYGGILWKDLKEKLNKNHSRWASDEKELEEFIIKE